MLDKVRNLIRRRAFKRNLNAWETAANSAHDIDLSQLRQLRNRARQLRNRVDRVAHIADGRLARPLIGSTTMRKPPQTEWAVRPEIWSGPISPIGVAAIEKRASIGNHAVIYHDCNHAELTYRQVRNRRTEDLAPFGLRIDVFRFDGSFVSLVLDLPDDATTDLRRNHILRLDIELETEEPIELFARLNVKYGPNVEQMLSEFPLNADEVMVEFDLEKSKISENRLERMWVELIFEGPEMNEINLRDVTMTRRPRAEY